MERLRGPREPEPKKQKEEEAVEMNKSSIASPTTQVIIDFVSMDREDILVYPKCGRTFRIHPIELIIRRLTTKDVKEGDRWEVRSGDYPDPQRATLLRIVDPNETMPEGLMCYVEYEAVAV